MTRFIKVPFLACAAVLTLLPGAHAESERSESKDNKTFEAQGHAQVDILGGLKSLAKAIAEAGVFADGVFQTSYNATVVDPKTSHNLDFKIESRIWGIPESDCGCPGVMALPFEIRLRTNLNQGQGVSVQDARASLVRLLFNSDGVVGVTAQAIGYAYRNYDLSQTRTSGFELASLTLNSALAVTQDGNYELVLKGTGSIGFPSVSTDNATIVAAARTAGQPVPNANNSSSTDTNVFPTSASVDGSVGVRIHRRVLVDVFAGLQQVSTHDLMVDPTDDRSSTPSGELKLTRKYYGAGVRVKAKDWLHILASVRRTSDALSISYATGTNAKDEKNDLSTNLTLETRW